MSRTTLSEPFATGLTALSPMGERVLAFSRQMFGNAEIREKHDPEIPGERYFLVVADVSNSASSLLALYDRWYDEVARIVPEECGLFRLMVNIRE